MAHAPAVPPDSSSYGTESEKGVRYNKGEQGRSEPSRAERREGGGEGEGRKVTHLDDGVGVPQGSTSRPTFRLERPGLLACGHLGLKSPLSVCLARVPSLHVRVTGSGAIRYDTIPDQFPCVLWFVLSIPNLSLPSPSPSPSPPPCASLVSLPASRSAELHPDSIPQPTFLKAVSRSSREVVSCGSGTVRGAVVQPCTSRPSSIDRGIAFSHCDGRCEPGSPLVSPCHARWTFRTRFRRPRAVGAKCWTV